MTRIVKYALTGVAAFVGLSYAYKYRDKFLPHPAEDGATDLTNKAAEGVKSVYDKVTSQIGPWFKPRSPVPTEAK